MTQEELIKKIDAEIAKLSDNACQMCMEDGGYRVACKDISDMLHEITKKIQPSLPSDLDEAAEKHESDNNYAEDYCGALARSFKAGAEWMSGQGETHEAEIIESVPYGGTKWKRCVKVWLDDQFQAKGDKVLVQIRKKETK